MLETRKDSDGGDGLGGDGLGRDSPDSDRPDTGRATAPPIFTGTNHEFLPAYTEYVAVEASPLGGFMPAASYRPIPIVWFVGALFVQHWALRFILAFLVQWPSAVAMALASLVIARRTFRRGMADAALLWRLATLMAMTVQCAWMAYLAYQR